MSRHVPNSQATSCFVETLPPGRYVYWKNTAQVKFVHENLCEAIFDAAGQDIMRSGIVPTALRSAHARVPCSVPSAPREMKVLMNKLTEAKKAQSNCGRRATTANLIARREETAGCADNLSHVSRS